MQWSVRESDEHKRKEQVTREDAQRGGFADAIMHGEMQLYVRYARAK